MNTLNTLARTRALEDFHKEVIYNFGRNLLIINFLYDNIPFMWIKWPLCGILYTPILGDL